MKIQPIRHNHSVCLLLFHFVVVCKRRRKELSEEITIDVIKNAIAHHPITIQEGEIGENDHIHLLVQAPATLSPAEIARIIKGCSQSAIRKIIPSWSGWSRSYYISSVGGNSLEAVQAYINNQNNSQA